MKTVCDYRQIIVLEKEEFDTSICRHLNYSEPTEFTREIDTFDELVDLVENDVIFNATIIMSLFGKKKVKLCKADLFDNKRIITEKNFKPFKIKCINKVDTRKNSFNTLMELLDADDFTEWCKDHGVTTICK